VAAACSPGDANGFAIVAGSLLLRKGAIWRRLIIVPQPHCRVSGFTQGTAFAPTPSRLRAPAHRQLTITADLGAVDQAAALAFFTEVAELAVRAGARPIPPPPLAVRELPA
jgi:putative membrane protein